MKEFYKQQTHECISDISWLKDLKSKGLQNFQEQGFPSVKNEHWRYTSIESFLKQQFFIANKHDITKAPSVNIIDFAAQDSVIQLTFYNGQLLDKPEELKDIIITPLDRAIELYPEKIKPYLDRINQCEHGFQALNTAMLHSGVFIYVPKGVQVTKPIWINFYHEGEMVAVYLRNLVIAEENSELSIIEHYSGNQEDSYFTNTITEVYADKGARITHHKIQNESIKSYHIGTLSIKQNAYSEVVTHSIAFGGKLVRSDINLSLDAPHARCFLNGIYMPCDKQHMDFHTLINHNVANCISEQDYKGIIKDNARAVFNGRVKVMHNAFKSEARQQNKNLVLSKNAIVDTKPQLEIFNNDVICTHGATVGQLDEDAIFYMATRGINKEDAVKYLVNAFAKENLENIRDKTVNSFINKLLDEYLS